MNIFVSSHSSSIFVDKASNLVLVWCSTQVNSSPPGKYEAKLVMDTNTGLLSHGAIIYECKSFMEQAEWCRADLNKGTIKVVSRVQRICSI